MFSRSRIASLPLFLFAWLVITTVTLGQSREIVRDALAETFTAPPPAARPWVYWMVMDGTLTHEGITADLEAMQRAGIGGAIYMETDLGLPRGPVRFMSPEWQAALKHAFREADRLGIEIALSSGPGWCGTGGPWVKPEHSMQHLVGSETKVTGPKHFDALLPQPSPRKPFFGEQTLTPELHRQWKEFYRDECVLAFPTPQGAYRIPDVDEKALYFRAPYSSQPGVKPYLLPDTTVLPSAQCIAVQQVIDVTSKMAADGRLVWDVPAGEWTVVRFGRTITGQTTRPAPAPGLGLESDKFDRAALDAHFESYIGTLLKATGAPPHRDRGLTALHFDSWEMSSQNWSANFRAEFRRRRGYDPLPYLPAMLGRPIESVDHAERFLWDLRKTAQELVIENHAVRLRELARKQGLSLSLEPYDLNPAGDLALGAAADVPMGEFWSHGFNTYYSVTEAVSVAHTEGRPVVGAEAFTSGSDAWRSHPATLKPQGDWALCAGINRFVFHRYAHQPWLDRFPGETFGPYGVHWDRTQTWWEMADAYHLYLARCQAMLRRGLPVADILYLDLEGGPDAFSPPASAMLEGLPDRRGHNFDGCAPGTLIARATVRDGRIVFPDGMHYEILVLPRTNAMTPALARKVSDLAAAGATVVGRLPERSPSLENFPKCDEDVARAAANLRRGKNVIADSSAPGSPAAQELYPPYAVTAQILATKKLQPDFESPADLRYVHRRDGDTDIYFVGNRRAEPLMADCRFRVTAGRLELWDPVTGERRGLPQFRMEEGRTTVPLQFEPQQSFFVIFRHDAETVAESPKQLNFPPIHGLTELTGPWDVCFDPRWGGPEHAIFAQLEDWAKRPEPGIRFYSGKAVYRQTFAAPAAPGGLSRQWLELGRVEAMARVKLNGRDLGVVWCAPWRIAVPAGLLKPTDNRLEITVANLWPNRLIGDSGLPAAKRLTWSSWNPYHAKDPLLPSGLLGPVRLLVEGQ